ncbi:MAG TPA: glucuronate isomerase [Phycisphaerae bacterium]|nr:glucuronate isomerase [Phycisphaerae bacterium]
MQALTDAPAVESAVRRAVADTAVTDIHTHLFPPSHGDLLLWGVDELLTYHYLVAELFTVAPASLRPGNFRELPKRRQADLVWEHVFLRHGGLSEAARGAITTLNSLGLDVAGRDLDRIRSWFQSQRIETYLPRVFELAGIDYAVMTNNPFNDAEVEHWRAGAPSSPCLKAALRIDSLMLDWPAAAKAMRAAGYKTTRTPNAASFAQARKFLRDWAERIAPAYLAASLDCGFAYPSRQAGTRILDRVVLPTARELNLPVAMMIGVRRQVNPALGDGGDGVGVADVTAVQHLCQRHGDVKFLVTMLSRVNQHELCVLARKFGNLHVFGCWWFCNDPSIIEEITRMRIELLGTAFTAQHSDARVLDQLIYKWSHTRAILADVLAEKYALQFKAGWRPTEDEIRRDVRAILGGSFEAFCNR